MPGAENDDKIFMATIVIRLDPRQLANPDLDLRYVLADTIVSLTNGLVQDDGYDYGAQSNAMYVFLHTTSPTETVPIVLNVLCHTPLLGNDLSRGSVVAVSPVDHDEQSQNYSVAFPSDYRSAFTFD